jgi:HSP20 family protein
MLTRWSNWGLRDWDNTFAALEELRREMNRVFKDAAQELPVKGAGGTVGLKIDLVDAGTALVVKAEVPGISEKDLSISLEENSLTIKGERQDEIPEGYAVHRKERGAFTFSRAYTLPCKVDAEKTTAVVKHGILELTLPKVPEAQPRQIQIQAK